MADDRSSQTSPASGSGASGASAPPTSQALAARLREQYRENDSLWMLYHLLERGADRVGADRLREAMWRKATERELAKGLPGTHTRSANRVIWNAYDWGDQGEEWTVSPEWRGSVITELMLANLPADAVALEIGPGAGRWSVALHQACRELILVDVSERAIELCRERLGDPANISFQVTDGASLPGVGDDSVDFVWSFDVFVHIAPSDQDLYMRELARVMRPGAKGVIHHAGSGGKGPEQWRSSMTAERFAEAVRGSGMTVIDQRDRWGRDGEYAVPTEGDVVTIFER